MKLMLKGTLLWVTSVFILLVICGIEGVFNLRLSLILLIVTSLSGLIYCCIHIISEEEFILLTGYKWFSNFIDDDLNEE